MKILAVHNRYLIGGGEDYCHTMEVALLRHLGHAVTEYVVSNEQVSSMGLLRTSLNTIWSVESYVKVKGLLETGHFDLMMVQNSFPLLSPSIYSAARSMHTPVIQFLQNYRLFCLNGFAYRNQRPCLDCMQKFVPWPGIKNACYRSSRAGSMVVASMLVAHRILGTWKQHVDLYISMTQISADIFQKIGLPSEKIIIKPNFLYPTPQPGDGSGNYALFVGRLSPEKGIHFLLQAWKTLGQKMKLKLVGEGPMEDLVKSEAASNPGIEYLGKLPPAEVLEKMGQAAFLIFPSQWYEGMPRTVIESLAVGTPVVATSIGAQKEMIHDGENGVLFQHDSQAEFIRKVESLIQHPAETAQMRRQARASFEENYTLEKNVILWQAIFNRLGLARE
jgi:glycosyltransferase involved in cell wall biosynthesis